MASDYSPPHTWVTLTGAPIVTVSPVGKAQGYPVNNGADFGPDTPGTTTSGIQEALTSLSTSGGTCRLLAGIFNVSTPITIIGDGIAVLGAGCTPFQPAPSGGTQISLMSTFTAGDYLFLSDPTIHQSTFSNSGLKFADFSIECGGYGSGFNLVGVWGSIHENVSVQNAHENGFQILETGSAGGLNHLVACSTYVCAGSGFVINSAGGSLVSCYDYQSAVSFEIGATGSNYQWPVNLYGCWSDNASQAGFYIGSTTVGAAEGTLLTGCAVNLQTSTAVGVYLYSAQYAKFVNLSISGGSSVAMIQNPNVTNCDGVVFLNTQFNVTGTTAYLYSGAAGSTTAKSVRFIGGSLQGAPTAQFNIQSGNPHIIVENFSGINGQGFAITTPAVPTSGSGYTNTFPFAIRIYVLTASGVTYTITDPSGNVGPSLSASAGEEITLDPGAIITPTYTTLTWKFYGT